MKEKFTLYNYSSEKEVEDVFNLFGLNHGSVIEGDIFGWGRKFYRMGLNIMTKTCTAGVNNGYVSGILYVSNKKFGQK